MKQRKTMENLLENNGSMGEAMREAGYSPETAKNPQQVTRSKGWAQLVEEYLPDDLLAKVHKEGLEATNKDGADYSVRHRYLDTAYKIKGKIVDKMDIDIKKRIISIDE